MRKLLIAALATGLIAGAFVAPATAKKKKTKAEAVTLHFHGPFVAGEIDAAETTANQAQSLPDGFQVMDATTPSETVPNSMGITNGVATPNRYCNGSELFPTWQGALTGRVKGDMTVYLHTISEYALISVDVFVDTMGGCNSTAAGTTDYVEPVATTTASATVGVTEIVFKDVDFKVLSHMVIMVTPSYMALVGERHDILSHGRVLYDATDYDSRVEFTCTPTSGKSCLPAS